MDTMLLDWQIFFSTIAGDLVAFGIICLVYGTYKNWRKGAFFYRHGEQPPPKPARFGDPY